MCFCCPCRKLDIANLVGSQGPDLGPSAEAAATQAAVSDGPNPGSATDDRGQDQEVGPGMHVLN